MPRAHYTFISGDLEGIYCHFNLGLGLLYKGLLIVTTTSCLVGFLFGQRPLLAGLENYERENGVWNTTFIEARKALGFTGRISLKETVEALDPNHPLYELEQRKWGWDWISYDFGSNIHNYCQRIPFLKERTMPSFLRLLEFRADAQLFFRNAVLSAICIRMFLSCVSGNYIWNLFHYRPFIRTTTLVLPLLDMLWMTFAMLVLCLQKDQDKLMRSWMYWHLPLFAAFFIAYSILYILFTATAFQKTWITVIQFLCICLFCSSFPHAYDSYLEILKDGGKPCFIDIPFSNAIAEYVAIASVYIFCCLQFQELVSFEGIITLCKMEYDDYFSHTADYQPAFSLEEAPVTSSSVTVNSDPRL